MDVLKKAWDTNGEQVQLIKTIEELAELQKEIAKYLIVGQSYNMANFIEELADVEIMIEQIERFFIKDQEAVEAARQKKIERLEARLNG